MEWYLECFKKYAVFDGRARRKEYWMFYLFNGIVCFLIAFLAAFIWPLTILFYAYGAAIIVPGIAVTARRLHDIGKSGVFMLIAFIPFIGGIILLVFLCVDSEGDPNQYGPNPKAHYTPNQPGYSYAKPDSGPDERYFEP